MCSTMTTLRLLYYLPGTTGWYTPFGGVPAMLWNPQVQSFGVRTNQFGVTITGSTNLVIVVEACTNLANSPWFPAGTNPTWRIRPTVELFFAT